MKTLKSIKNRINVIKKTSKITQAMKIIASSILKESEINIKNSEKYNNEIKNFINILYSNSKNRDDIDEIIKENFDNKKNKNELIIIINTDKGLCGGFINKLANNIKKKKIDKNTEILMIGNKLKQKLKLGDNNYIKQECIKFMSKKFNKNIFEQCSSIMSMILSKKKFSNCRIIYSKFNSIRNQEIKDMNFFSLDFLKKNVNNSNNEDKINYNCESYDKKYIKEIIYKYFNVNLFNIYSNSIASECSNRMISMHNATKNSKEIIKDLTLIYNKNRQMIVTKELIEIISGSESTK